MPGTGYGAPDGFSVHLALFLWPYLSMVPRAFGAEAASDQTIITFIVQRSPRIREAQALLPTTGNMLKIEAKGRALFPNLGQEGQGVGIVAFLPFLDRQEKAERTLKVLGRCSERPRRFFRRFAHCRAQVQLGEELLREMDVRHWWLKRRVQEGVEYQKEANRFLSDLYGKKMEVEQRRAQIGSLIEKLAGLIVPAQRPVLRAMLNGL